MQPGDVVFLKYPWYWLHMYRDGRRKVRAVQTWFHELVHALRPGTLVVLVEDAMSATVFGVDRTLPQFLLNRYEEVLEDASRDFLGEQGAERLNRINHHPWLQQGLHAGGYGFDLGLAGMLSIMRVRAKPNTATSTVMHHQLAEAA